MVTESLQLHTNSNRKTITEKLHGVIWISFCVKDVILYYLCVLIELLLKKI